MPNLFTLCDYMPSTTPILIHYYGEKVFGLNVPVMTFNHPELSLNALTNLHNIVLKFPDPLHNQ